MKFTKLKKTKSYGNFKNISLEIEIEDNNVYEANELIDKTIDELIRIKEAESEAQAKYTYKQYDIELLDKEIEEKKKTIDRYIKFMEKHDIQIKDELPF